MLAEVQGSETRNGTGFATTPPSHPTADFIGLQFEVEIAYNDVVLGIHRCALSSAR